MAAPSRLDLELNELKWWSKWTKTTMLGRNAYVMTSSSFRELFFNRACFVDCRAASAYMPRAEEMLSRSGVRPAYTVHEGCAAASRALARSGSRLLDTMSVMFLSHKSGSVESDAGIRRVGKERIVQWSRAYLQAFYGDDRLLPAVTRVVGGLVADRSATLLEARLGGSVAGVLALYRTRHVAGVYCVGTVPSFRRRGVAGALLDRAAALAESEGRYLILQTLESDGVEAFYRKRGFVRVYRKRLFSKES